MSVLVDTILNTLKDGALKQISAKSGITPQQGQLAAQSALPMILEFAAKSLGGGAPAQGGGLLQAMTAAISSTNGSVVSTDTLSSLLGANLSSLTALLQQKAGIDQTQASSYLSNLLPVISKALSSSGANSSNMVSLLSSAATHFASSGGASKMLSGSLDQDGDGDVDMSDMLKVGVGLVGGFLKK